MNKPKTEKKTSRYIIEAETTIDGDKIETVITKCEMQCFGYAVSQIFSTTVRAMAESIIDNVENVNPLDLVGLCLDSIYEASSDGDIDCEDFNEDGEPLYTEDSTEVNSDNKKKSNNLIDFTGKKGTLQ